MTEMERRLRTLGRKLKREQDRFEATREQTYSLVREAVRKEGMSWRQVGALVGMSHQRIERVLKGRVL